MGVYMKASGNRIRDMAGVSRSMQIRMFIKESFNSGKLMGRGAIIGVNRKRSMTGSGTRESGMDMEFGRR